MRGLGFSSPMKNQGPQSGAGFPEFPDWVSQSPGVNPWNPTSEASQAAGSEDSASGSSESDSSSSSSDSSSDSVLWHGGMGWDMMG